MTIQARRGGLDVQPPPWRCARVSASVFALPAGHAALQSLCDRTLNIPSGGRVRYEPVIDLIGLTFQRLSGMRSASPAATQHSTLHYNEVAIWVMVRDAMQADAPERLLLPYIFADNTVAVAAGREIYGYPKEQGYITLPGTTAQGSVQALAAVNPATTAAAIAGATLITCRPRAMPPLSLDLLDHTASLEMLEEAIGFATSGNLLGAAGAFIEMIVGQRLNFVFLRQVAALSGGAACDLQQVVAATAVVSNVGMPDYIGWHRIHFGAFGSHPFATDLGLRLSPADQGIDAAGASIAFGFELGTGVVL